MPERLLRDATPGEPPSDEIVQQIIEAESGRGAQGIRRVWQAAASASVVLVSDALGLRLSRDAGATPPTAPIVDGTPAGGQLSGSYPDPGLSQATLDLLCPPGKIDPYGGGTAPAGWLLCDGTVYANSSYPRLQAVLQYTYGGNGATTFAVPDLRGRVPLGASATHPRGSVGGTESPAHTHLQTHAHAPGAHTHPPGVHTHPPGIHTHPPGVHTHPPGTHTHGTQSHTHIVDVDHDHPAAAGAATATSTPVNTVSNVAGTFAVPATNHNHPVDLPSLGTALKTSQDYVTTGTAPGPSTGNTGQPTSTDNTGQPTAASTGTPSSTDNTGTPTAANTGNDSTANGATWTTDGLPPFGVTTYIIRTGS